MLPFTPYWPAIGPTQFPPSFPYKSQQLRAGTAPLIQATPSPWVEQATIVFSIAGALEHIQMQIPAPKWA